MIRSEKPYALIVYAICRSLASLASILVRKKGVDAYKSLYYYYSSSPSLAFIFTTYSLPRLCALRPRADDKQSLAHLFWFGDEVDVVGIVADWASMSVPSLTASAVEQIEIAIQEYEADYFASGGGSGTRFQVEG